MSRDTTAPTPDDPRVARSGPTSTVPTPLPNTDSPETPWDSTSVGIPSLPLYPWRSRGYPWSPQHVGAGRNQGRHSTSRERRPRNTNVDEGAPGRDHDCTGDPSRHRGSEYLNKLEDRNPSPLRPGTRLGSQKRGRSLWMRLSLWEISSLTCLLLSEGRRTLRVLVFGRWGSGIQKDERTGRDTHHTPSLTPEIFLGKNSTVRILVTKVEQRLFRLVLLLKEHVIVSLKTNRGLRRRSSEGGQGSVEGGPTESRIRTTPTPGWTRRRVRSKET